MDWLIILAFVATGGGIGALVAFWPSRRARRMRALNRLTDRELNKPEAAS